MWNRIKNSPSWLATLFFLRTLLVCVVTMGFIEIIGGMFGIKLELAIGLIIIICWFICYCYFKIKQKNKSK